MQFGSFGKVLVRLGPLIVLAIACSEQPGGAREGRDASRPDDRTVQTAPPTGVARNAYFGALHVHTAYSFDAWANGVETTPAEAYAWARGEPIAAQGEGSMSPTRTPLDFYAISDHAEWLGMFHRTEDPESDVGQPPFAARLSSEDAETRGQALAELIQALVAGESAPLPPDPDMLRSSWEAVVSAADAAYEPGVFTTFPAFEWTGMRGGQSLHRVVVFGHSRAIPDVPLSALEAGRLEDLWSWMDRQREGGAALTAIPHGRDAGEGMQVVLEEQDSQPRDTARLSARSRNERVYEIIQIAGSMETHPDLSPDDEFADFEPWIDPLPTGATRSAGRPGGFVRERLLAGLRARHGGGGNPFKYGFLGDSNTHNGAAGHEEYNHGVASGPGAGALRRLREQQESSPRQVRRKADFGSAGLAGVWAEQNTREAIFDAIQRRETFGTSGPRIRVRFFAGWDFSQVDVSSNAWMNQAYDYGVPMGGTLEKAPEGRAPVFMAWAMKDPDSGNLDRLQIVKGWVDEAGELHERNFDINWSGDREPGEDGRLPPVENTVDPTSANYTDRVGSAQLAGFWVDPDFDPRQDAFYYIRVLEIPTPRWTTYEAVANGVGVPEDVPVSIQERAWSSPIWYEP